MRWIFVAEMRCDVGVVVSMRPYGTDNQGSIPNPGMNSNNRSNLKSISDSCHRWRSCPEAAALRHVKDPRTLGE